MAIPNVSLVIQQGLGGIPASAGRTSLTLGICSGGLINSLYGFADIPTLQGALGSGPLVEAMADKINVAGGLQYAMPLNPTTVGTVSATDVTKVTGAATIVGSFAPTVPMSIKITTGGVLGTMLFSASLNGGAYGAPVLSPVGGVYQVPGTQTKITFPAGTYVLGDVYGLSTLGAFTLAGGGVNPAGFTQASSPGDAYDVRVAISTGGALGTAVFVYSVDGNNNLSSQILVPASGKYVVAGTGILLTFAGTFNAGDIYAMTTTTASFSASDVATALAAFLATRTPVAFVHVIGAGASAAAAATLAATVDSAMTAAETAQLFEFGIIECPTTEVDSALATAFVTFVSRRVMVCAGDIAHISSATPGRIIRRNCSVVIGSRLCAIKPSEHPGYVGSTKGNLPNVSSLYPNGSSAGWLPDVLDANRFATLRSLPNRGYYVTRGRIMATAGDDYDNVMNRRVIDVACTQGIFSMQPFLNKDLKAPNGTIFDPEAVKIECIVRNQLEAAIVNTDDATSVTVTLSRTEKILITKSMPTTIAVVPKGYAENIPILIGLINPAIAA